MRPWLTPVALLPAALVPVYPILGFRDAFVGDHRSELPVKLWCAHTFPDVGWFGGIVDSIGHPNPGPLNNPDLVSTAWFALWADMLGDAWTWNSLVVLQLFLTMLAMVALVRDLCDDRVAGWTAAVVAALTPMVLSYGVVGAVSDLLNLWPYPLAVRHALRAARGERPALDALLFGTFVGIGFITCPYNLVIFLSWLPALLLALPALFNEAADADGTEFALRRVGIVVVLAGLAAAATGGLYALQLRAIMGDTQSQMSDALVQSTRHVAPWTFLEPTHESRYVALLFDYFAVGKAALVERDAGSHYARAYSPGILAMLLAAYGVWRGPWRRASLVFLGAALLGVLASCGPFLTFDGRKLSEGANNPVYLLFYDLLGAKILLEPFRYAIPAAMALAVAAGLGAAALPLRLRVLAPVLVVAETLLLSPAPYPLPAVRLIPPAAYSRLDDLLPPGPILELPWFHQGTARFNRLHFYWQLTHGRPIPDEVAGFVPQWLQDNAFTASLISPERRAGPLAVAPPEDTAIEAGLREFLDAGFVGIVVHPEAYADQGYWPRVDQQLVQRFGDPVYRAERVIWKVAPSTQ